MPFIRHADKCSKGVVISIHIPSVPSVRAVQTKSLSAGTSLEGFRLQRLLSCSHCAPGCADGKPFLFCHYFVFVSLHTVCTK